jgi:hypothetical protein
MMVTRDLLEQAVYQLAVGSGQLRERLERSSVPLAALRREDLETEEEFALYARVQLGLSQLRRAADAGDRGAAGHVPLFALEATASHIVELRDITTRRMLRAAGARGQRRRGHSR